MTGAEQYSRWVLDPANAIETGRLVKLAAQRFLNDLTRTDIYFDEDEAVKMVNFCQAYCYQWEGDWRDQLMKFELWQRFIFEQLHGWFRTETKTLRLTEAYVQVSKKNGKSTMCAGEIDYHLIANERVNTPKVFTAANNEDQAKICVNMAGRIIERSPELAELVDDDVIRLFNYKDNITEIVHREKDGFVKAFSKESSDKKSKTAGGKHGVNASLGIVDEFGMSPDHGASKPIKTSMASRREGLMLYITTAGFNMDGPCYRELRDIGIKVLEGTVIKDNYLPVIFEIDPPIGEDGKPGKITVQWLLDHPEVWRQATPNLGVSVNPEFLKEMLDDAKTYGGTTEVEVLTLNFNMWVDSPEVFIPADVWTKNHHADISEKDLEGRDCYGGLELISGKHLNCFSLIFPDVKGYTVIRPIFWMPDEFINSRETDQYKNWKDKFIHSFIGNVSENDLVIELLLQEIGRFNMHSFAFKKGTEHSDIVQALIKSGLQGNPISHGYQGISTPTLAWEEMLTAGQIEHFNNPVLAWMNSNCMAQRKDNDLRLEKSGSRVVGIYASINALAQWKTIEAEGGSAEIGILYL
jgi:phage terminase large subunit-like protein